MRLIEILREHGQTIAAAESCTGGAFMAALVQVPGASEVFRGGVVAYSKTAKKQMLGVQGIEDFGVVSEEVAREMAVGAREKFGADIGVGVTGYAHTGQVCFAITSLRGTKQSRPTTHTFTKNFTGSRIQVIDAAVNFLIQWLCESLEKI